MFPVKQIQGVVILTYLVAFVQSHCTRGTKNQLTNKNDCLTNTNVVIKDGEYGPNRPVIINYGSLPPKPVLSTTSLLDVTPPMYQKNNQNEVTFPFQITVVSKNIYGRTQIPPPVPQPPPPPPPTSTPLQMPAKPKPSSITFGTLVSQTENISPEADINGTTDKSVENEKTIETALSLDNDKGFGHSSILTYNIGSFQGLKIVGNNKISNQVNGVNNSPGSKLANFTVNNGNTNRNDTLGGPKEPSTQFNGLNKSGSSNIQEFVVNNNSQ